VQLDPGVLYVDAGSVITSAGTAAGIEASLYLLRQAFGAEVANAVARRMVVSPHRDGGQAQFIEQPVPPPDDPLGGVLTWAPAKRRPTTDRGDARRPGAYVTA
jgi:transcriptional regulator GlxA family with amidase domain